MSTVACHKLVRKMAAVTSFFIWQVDFKKKKKPILNDNKN